MAYHSGDIYRAGSTAFTATETNLSSLYLGGTQRDGYRVVATHQGITGGTNDVSTLHSSSGNPTAGTFTLTLGGKTTAAIAYNASPATIQAALLALQNTVIQNIAYFGSLPAGSISVSGSATGYAAGDVTITFQNALGNIPITLTIAAGGLTGGGTNSVVHTTTGVGPTCAITLQHNDDNSSTWDAWRKFGTLDVPTWSMYRPSMIFGTPRKYLSMTLTFGGTGTYKNLQVVVVDNAEGFGG
jgi:hypothetical protein